MLRSVITESTYVSTLSVRVKLASAAPPQRNVGLEALDRANAKPEMPNNAKDIKWRECL